MILVTALSSSIGTTSKTRRIDSAIMHKASHVQLLLRVLFASERTVMIRRIVEVLVELKGRVGLLLLHLTGGRLELLVVVMHVTCWCLVVRSVVHGRRRVIHRIVLIHNRTILLGSVEHLRIVRGCERDTRVLM